MEREKLSFDKENVEERYMPTLESKIHSWLVDAVPKDIQTKASNRAHTQSARMLIVEYYFTAIPGPDVIGSAMSKFIRVPTNTATTGVEVLANIESWKTAIQINYEVTKTMPSQQDIRAAFQRLINLLKLADEQFRFHQNLRVSQVFETQKVSDEGVLKYFQQTEEKIHSMDTRKLLKFPDKAPPSNANAINTGDGQTKPKGKGKQKSQSVPPTTNNGQHKGAPQKKVEKGTGKQAEGKSQSKQTNQHATPAPAPTNPPLRKQGRKFHR